MVQGDQDGRPTAEQTDSEDLLGPLRSNVLPRKEQTHRSPLGWAQADQETGAASHQGLC